jgi:hypothetical protein
MTEHEKDLLKYSAMEAKEYGVLAASILYWVRSKQEDDYCWVQFDFEEMCSNFPHVAKEEVVRIIAELRLKGKLMMCGCYIGDKHYRTTIMVTNEEQV